MMPLSHGQAPPSPFLAGRRQIAVESVSPPLGRLRMLSTLNSSPPPLTADNARKCPVPSKHPRPPALPALPSEPPPCPITFCCERCCDVKVLLLNAVAALIGVFHARFFVTPPRLHPSFPSSDRWHPLSPRPPAGRPRPLVQGKRPCFSMTIPLLFTYSFSPRQRFCCGVSVQNLSPHPPQLFRVATN